MHHHSNRRPPGDKRKREHWTVRVPVVNLDTRNNGLSDRAFRLMMILEGFARAKAVCYPSNVTLAALFGKSPRRVKEVLLELEQAGWIKREVVTDGEVRRSGIALLRRLAVSFEEDAQVADPTIWDGGRILAPDGGRILAPEEDEVKEGAPARRESPKEAARRIGGLIQIRRLADLGSAEPGPEDWPHEAP